MEKFNIYHRQDGRWEGRISKGKTPDGNRKFDYFFGYSKAEVCEKMSKVRQQNYLTTDKTIAEIFNEWFQNARYRIKESTASNYLMKAKKHILPEFGEILVDSVCPENIHKFIENKMNQKLSARYIADILVLMKSLFKYAVRTYHIFNPMDGIPMPRQKKPEITLLDDEGQKQLQQYIAENQNTTSMGIALSMSTGIRIGELCALQWKDIDLEKRILTVRKTMQRIQIQDAVTKTKLIITEPKSESSQRSIPIPECMMPMLQKFQANGENFVLSGGEKPVEPRVMQYRFAKILKNVKLPSVHFHALRHIFATNCIKWGFDIKTLSELLGHSSVEITLNRYVHSDFEQKRACMKQVNLNF